MIKAQIEFNKMTEALEVVNTVSHVIKSDKHVNDLMKQANTIMTAEFVMHMSRMAVAAPKMFGHMYDWGGIGDPNARLWKHKMVGRGSVRNLTFDFKASKRAVPISSKLRAVGVKRNHTFVWKAPILELGLPVRISPKLAKVLVFEQKEKKNPSSSIGSGYAKNGVVYFNGLINIDRQGSATAWNAFTEEFLRWFSSGKPEAALKNLMDSSQRTVKKEVEQKVASTKFKNKTLTFKPVGIDEGFNSTLSKMLEVDYIKQAANRRMMTDE